MEADMARWIDPQPVDVSDALREVAAQALAHVSGEGQFRPVELVSALLVRRGLGDAAAARRYLDPSAYAQAPPEQLPDLEHAARRLATAAAGQESVAVWGDFDVDGQTATALYVQALGALGAEVRHTIPSRQASHGLHPGGVQRLIDAGVSLIVTADTGVDGHRAVDLAAARGVEVLITDHHDLPERLPAASAVVNPRRLPRSHPLYGLPGVGVAYQVVRALYGGLDRDPGSMLDLVALGIVADVAPLRDDVRYLLQRGLDVLRQTERTGLRALAEVARLDLARLDAEDIGFALAPRLNALSRVGQDLDPSAGVELLTTDDRTRARTIATRLHALNERRRLITRQVTQAALAQLSQDRRLLEGPAIVVASANWEPGIVGVVAGRLADRYGKPAVVFSAPEGELARGSARSVQGVDIHAAIAAQSALLYRYGGHPMAAGLSLPGEQIDAFRRGLWRTLAALPPPPEPDVEIAAYLSLDQLSLALHEAVEIMAPFGEGNARPVFVSRDLEVAGSATIGRTREHRRVEVRDGEGRMQQVMWWRSADLPLPEGRFDLAYTIGVNTFRGDRSLQLTWLEAQAAPTVQVAQPAAPPPEVSVHDLRDAVNPVAELALLWAQVEPREAVVWGEGGAHTGDIPSVGRSELCRADMLVIWTAPPSPTVLRDALSRVEPREVTLFAIDPGLDAPAPFLRRLAGLTVHVLQRHDGQSTLATLAAGMAHAEPTVALGLSWLVRRGQLTYARDPGGGIVLRTGDGRVRDGLDEANAELAVALEETAAYRAYYRRADPAHIVR
jgi:single-stranded-DNA-specific exonuclease